MSIGVENMLKDGKEIKKIIESEDISKIENVISALSLLGGLHKENYFNKNVSEVFEFWVSKLKEYQKNPDTDGPGLTIFEYFTTKRTLQQGNFIENFIKAISDISSDNFKTDLKEAMINLETALGNLNNIGPNDDSFSSDMLLSMDVLIKC